MKLTKERKILLGVLATGVSALMADQLFILGDTGPQEAAASAPAPNVPSSAVAAPNPTFLTGDTRADPAAPVVFDLASKLNKIPSDALPERDLTRLPDHWQSEVNASALIEQQPIQQLSYQQFEASGHSVQAIVWEQAEPVVMVDGRVLKIGDRIGDFRITAIAERSLSLQPVPGSPNKAP